ncbi:MAG: PA14 domain-containing protein [Verrucomicrobiia bacterium]
MPRILLPLAMAVIAAAATAVSAGTFTSDFSNPNQTGFTLTSNFAPRPDGSEFQPVIENGHLVLTYNENSEQGTIVLDDLDGGNAIDSFTMRFKLQMGPGSGSPADGLAVSFGADVDPAANFGEEGTGNGISVCFDIYDNGSGEAPAIDVKYKGAVLATKKFAKADMVTGQFEDVEITLARNGMVNVSHKGQKVHENVFIADFEPTPGLFAIGARTGGENGHHWIDDLSITTTRASATAPSITTQPQSQTVLEGAPVTFGVAFEGSTPVTIQWLSNNVAIAGATGLSYSIERVPFTANGAKFKANITNPTGSAASQEATLTVTQASKPLNLLYATGNNKFNSVRVWFSDPLDPASAQTAANYSLSGGLTISAAKLVAPAGSPGDNMVDLTTSAQTPGQTYTLTVTGVKDQTAAANTVAPGSSVEFSAWTLSPGYLTFEHYDNLTGAGEGDIDLALEDPRVIAGTPTTLGLLAGRFDTRTFFPTDEHENYLGRITGWITPTESGDYYFFLRSDDAGRLYLSANETLPNPATDVPIATEPGCCGVFYEPDSGDPATTPAPITLQAGKRYGVLAFVKEAGGGDYLMVGWRKSTDSTPAANVPYLPGQFLSTYIDPNTDLRFTAQPTDQPGSLPSAGIEILSKDFNANDGGFTVTNSAEEPPAGWENTPWVYDPVGGKWVANGSIADCGGPYNSQLNSALYKFTQDGAASISFSHRYSFEGDLYDAGQVRISVNGGEFTLVPAGNFTDNGYANGNIIGNGIALGKRGFNANSPGYADGTFITSKATLGNFKKDDTLVVQFLGAWDECSSGSNPNWEIDSMKLEMLPMTIVDFAKDNGGYTVENTTPAPPGPWVYDAAKGQWAAEGSEDGCTGPYNSRLTSPAIVVAEADEVTLSFTHRYSFEGDYYDGGQVQLSVNGAPFAPVPAEAFSANGYAEGAIVGTGVLKDLRAFNGTSAGYGTSNLITSSAVLGSFNKGDTLVLQFVGAWDECSSASHPNWVIKNVQLVFGKAAKPVTFEAEVQATLQGSPVLVVYQWQRDDGSGFVDIGGATTPAYRFYPVAADLNAKFRLQATVPGKNILSDTVKIVEGGGPVETPAISIARSGATITVTYTGTLQFATAVNGPYLNVAGAQSPYVVPPPPGNIFYRAVK